MTEPFNFQSSTDFANTASGSRRRAKSRKNITPPANVVATPVSGTQIQLSWVPSSGIFIHGYKIFKNGIETDTTTSTPYCVCFLDVATTYSFSVQGYNNYGGISAASNTVTETTLDTLAPTSPQNLTVTQDQALVVNLSWDAALDNVGVSGYKLYRDGTQIGGTITATVYVDREAVEGVYHSYTVLAVDSAGNQSLLSTPTGLTFPAVQAFDPRKGTTQIPHDYLWSAELADQYQWQAIHTNFSTWRIIGDYILYTPIANFIYYAVYEKGLDTTFDPILANPLPEQYTNHFWNRLAGTKTRDNNTNYSWERYDAGAAVDSMTYAVAVNRPPLTGLNGALNKIQNPTQLLNLYNATIFYKAETTYDECVENTYMFYFRQTRYLPDFSNATTGSGIHAFASHWSAQHVNDFKTWALSMKGVTNKYFTGPAIP